MRRRRPDLDRLTERQADLERRLTEAERDVAECRQGWADLRNMLSAVAPGAVKAVEANSTRSRQ